MNRFTLSFLCTVVLAGPSFAEETNKVPAAAIQDNSFLVEEAYNQEEGVVQHIFNLGYGWNRQKGPDDREWAFAFTQEWPVFGQRNQFSYTLPTSWLSTGGRHHSGLGDVGLNYRFQALFEDDQLPAFAPRFSLYLPTGDRRRDLGNGTLGYQINLPVSKIVHDRWSVHFNAGSTLVPDMHGRDPVSYNLGASAIYAVSSTLHLMLESVMEFSETATRRGDIEREVTALISPGARYAFNLSWAQIVVGAAAPIGMNAQSPDYGAFLYLSVEHRFLPER